MHSNTFTSFTFLRKFQSPHIFLEHWPYPNARIRAECFILQRFGIWAAIQLDAAHTQAHSSRAGWKQSRQLLRIPASPFPDCIAFIVWFPIQSEKYLVRTGLAEDTIREK
jgi:hypothetical protein